MIYRLICQATSRSSTPSACHQRSRRGVTLFEVVLAVAILAITLGILAQQMGIATRGARRAATVSHAAVHAETIMAELLSGMIPLESTGETEVDVDPNYVYSVEVTDTPTQWLLSARVAVSHTGSAADEPDFELVRWVPDPEYVPPETTTASSSTSGTAGSSGTTGTNSSGTNTNSSTTSGSNAGGATTGGQTGAGQTGANQTGAGGAATGGATGINNGATPAGANSGGNAGGNTNNNSNTTTNRNTR